MEKNNNVAIMEETKNLLGLMEESEEKLTLLHQDLKYNEDCYQQIKTNLKELRNINNENIAELEDINNVKTNIKEQRVKFFTSAELIYTSGQELYGELGVLQKNAEQTEEIFSNNEQNLMKKISEYRREEVQLQNELDKINKEQLEQQNRRQLQEQLLANENEELRGKLSTISEETDMHRNSIKDCSKLNQLQKYCKESITKTQERLKSTDDGIHAALELLSNIEKKETKSRAEIEECMKELDKKTEEAEFALSDKLQTLDETKSTERELLNKLQIIQMDNADKEKEYELLKSDLHNIITSIKEKEEKTTKEVNMYKASLLEDGETLSIEKGLNERLKTEISSLTVKVEEVDKEIDVIQKDINILEDRPKDLEKEIDIRQNEFKNLKLTRRKLKEQYNQQLIEEQTETKKVQQEIDDVETKIKKLQEDIDREELELNKLKTEEEHFKNEKHIQSEKSGELDDELCKLRLQVSKVKRENRENLTCNNSRPKKIKKHHHWDSDSSIEGEDRRFSQMAKEKLKQRQLQENKL